jgi:hypothetical protein
MGEKSCAQALSMQWRAEEQKYGKKPGEGVEAQG